MACFLEDQTGGKVAYHLSFVGSQKTVEAVNDRPKPQGNFLMYNTL